MANRRNLQNLINQKLQGLDKEDAISALENEVAGIKIEPQPPDCLSLKTKSNERYIAL